eukprot:gene36352-biopygen23880
MKSCGPLSASTAAHWLIDEECVFQSPAVHTPQVGKAITTKYLRAAMEVLGTPDFHYVEEWYGERPVGLGVVPVATQAPDHLERHVLVVLLAAFRAAVEARQAGRSDREHCLEVVLALALFAAALPLVGHLVGDRDIGAQTAQSVHRAAVQTQERPVHVAGAAGQYGRHNISFCAVNPGPVRTERWAGLVGAMSRDMGISYEEADKLAPASIPLGRIAEVEEVANLVVMLSSPLVQMANGTMIEIDGGQDKALMDRFRDR